jgi:hypothetical protein
MSAVAMNSRGVMLSASSADASSAVSTGTMSWTTAARQAASAGSTEYHNV